MFLLTRRLSAALIAALLFTACTAGTPVSADDDMALPTLEPVALAEGEKLRVVATTSIIGDVVAQVGGTHIDLTVLIAPGQDPHSYQPVARDLAQVERAHVVFVNGLGLEEGLLPAVKTVAHAAPLVPVSAGVEVLAGSEHAHEHEEEEGEHEHGEGDPHTWMDPHNVILWAENIAAALTALDPAHAEDYRANAEAYQDELRTLDAYIREQVGRIPPERRKLVTNHEALAYFAQRYGFEVVGTVYLGASQLAEPSAGEMAQLVETIRAEGVPAIFVETTVNDALARAIAREVGQEIGIYTLYTGSLGPPGSPADTYIGMMRANIETIVAALGTP